MNLLCIKTASVQIKLPSKGRALKKEQGQPHFILPERSKASLVPHYHYVFYNLWGAQNSQTENLW